MNGNENELRSQLCCGLPDVFDCVTQPRIALFGQGRRLGDLG